MNNPIENQAHSPGPSPVTPSVGAAEKGGLPTLAGVIFQPQTAFRSLGKRPVWLPPLAACLILVLLATFLIVNRMGVTNIMRSALQGSPQAEEIAQKAEESSFTKTLIYVSPLVQTPIVLVVVASVFLLVFMLAGVETNFKMAFSVTAHSFFAYSLVATLLSLVTVYATKDFANLDLKNLTATNVGFFFDPAETSKFLYGIMSSLDVLSFWLIYLLALGFAETSPKTRIQKTLPLVLVVWAVYVIGKAAISSLFGH